MDQDTKRRLSLTLEENIETIEALFEFPPCYTRDKANIDIIEGDKEAIEKMKEAIAKCKLKREKIIACLKACKTAEERDKIMCGLNLSLDE